MENEYFWRSQIQIVQLWHMSKIIFHFLSRTEKHPSVTDRQIAHQFATFEEA